MAITTVSVPSTLSNLVNEPFAFEFSMTPVDTVTERRRFGYQLLDSDDNPVSAKELITPKDGETFCIDFNQDICGLVSTGVPTCEGSSNNHPEMEGVFKLQVFEHVFNKDTCQISIENENVLGDYTVINAANQYWGAQLLGSGGWGWLNPMAGNLEMCRSRCQLIYLWSNNSINIGMTARSVSGINYTIVRSHAGVNPRVKSFVINPAEFAALMTPGEAATEAENLKRIQYISVEVDGTKLVHFKLKTCCNVQRIAWQHSGGGYSFMQFDGDMELSATTKGTEVYRYQPKGTSFSPTLEDARTLGGKSIGQRESYEQVSLVTYFDAREERDYRYLQDFLSSGSYFYEYKAFTGSFLPGPPTYQLVKFIPNTGTVKYHKTEEILELRITGKVARPHQMPNYEI